MNVTIDDEQADGICVKLSLSGHVQGVGMRPALYRAAEQYGIAGYVRNTGLGVELVVQGSENTVELFVRGMRDFFPQQAVVDSIERAPAVYSDLHSGFLIQDSGIGSCQGLAAPDYAMCPDCEEEFGNPASRRFRYPFISCTQCGPRFSILSAFPIDRVNTSLRNFNVCTLCEKEYHTSTNRRFHAQNISCAECGPEMEIQGEAGRSDIVTIIDACVASLQNGDIVAIKGVTGYRLFCDATNDLAVTKLRERKNRKHKPFALMIGSEDSLENYVSVCELASVLLNGCQKPIVILPEISSRPDKPSLSDNIAPGLTCLGVMLPATGFETLLTRRFGKPLVATSANLSGRKLISHVNGVDAGLDMLADLIVHHNMKTQNGLDDAVYGSDESSMFLIRAGRGISPQEYHLPFHLKEPVVALGAQMKNSIAIAWADRLIVSGPLGDMSELGNWQLALDQVDELKLMYGIEINHYIVDEHPGFVSHDWVKTQNVSFSTVQHHKAHASALCLEQYSRENMLVFVWDGNGYGEQGELWGGETFIGMAGAWSRVASLLPFALPGGSRAILEPWRIALSLCRQAGVKCPVNGQHTEIVNRMLEDNINCPASSAIGRLFDGVAALLGLISVVSYDGQAAMLLESSASESNTDDLVMLNVKKGSVDLVDWRPLIEYMSGSTSSVSKKARVFHNTLVDLVVSQVRMQAEGYAVSRVGFSGGVFQNALLRKLLRKKFATGGVDLVFSERVPVNDAGICIGQVMEYAAFSERSHA